MHCKAVKKRAVSAVEIAHFSSPELYRYSKRLSMKKCLHDRSSMVAKQRRAMRAFFHRLLFQFFVPSCKICSAMVKS